MQIGFYLTRREDKRFQYKLVLKFWIKNFLKVTEIDLFCLRTDRAICHPSNKYLSDILDVQNVVACRTGDGNGSICALVNCLLALRLQHLGGTYLLCASFCQGGLWQIQWPSRPSAVPKRLACWVGDVKLGDEIEASVTCELRLYGLNGQKQVSRSFASLSLATLTSILDIVGVCFLS